ncbi:hypothetical protein B0H14DRAFT_829372 [Mycena olivaceomarginata]|nr:hypothetical protein B0H14DRAFT_829372 [Mycena olivaceomarginata]
MPHTTLRVALDYACYLCGFHCGNDYPYLDKRCVAFTFHWGNYPSSFVVPLSAYTIVIEATYTPNASLPALPLSGLVPSILQESSYSGSFSPQTLAPGQTIRPNGSIYSYDITGAYNGFDTSQPVSTFSYYNNPLSDSCDITTMTINALSRQLHAFARITCWTPIVYILTIDISSVWSSTGVGDVRSTSLNGFYYDLVCDLWFVSASIFICPPQARA